MSLQGTALVQRGTMDIENVVSLDGTQIIFIIEYS